MVTRWRCLSCRGVGPVWPVGRVGRWAGVGGADRGEFPGAAGGAAGRYLPAMLVAAAEPAGEPVLVWRAAEWLGIGAEAVAPAADAGLLTIGERVMFRIRWCGRRCTGPRRRPSGGPRTRRWPPRPIRRPTPIAGPGTARRPRWNLMRRSRRSWSGRRAGPRRAAGWPRWPLLGALGRADPGPGSPRRAGAGRGAGQIPGRRVRRGPGTAGHRGGGAAGSVPAGPGGPAARPDRVLLQPRQ